MEYLFLDESGNLNKNGTDYFVIVIFKVRIDKDRKRIKNITSNARKRKVGKELKKQKEVKFYNISNHLRKYILKKINGINIEIFYIFINKTLAQNRNLLSNKNPNLIYIAMVIELLLNMKITRNTKLRVDMFLPVNERDDLNNTIKQKIPYIKSIYHSYSENWKEIQIADVLAGSYFQFLEREKKEYIELLNKNYEVYEYKNTN